MQEALFFADKKCAERGGEALSCLSRTEAFSLSLPSKMAPADTTKCCWVSARSAFCQEKCETTTLPFSPPVFLKGRTREERLKVSLLKVYFLLNLLPPFSRQRAAHHSKAAKDQFPTPFLLLLLLKPFPAYPTLSSSSFLSRLGLPNVPPSPPLFFPQSKPDISVSHKKRGIDWCFNKEKTLFCDFKSLRKRNQPLPQHLDSRN